MSAPNKTLPVQVAEAHAASESFAVKLATTEEHVKGLGEDMHGLERRVGSMESEMRRGFSTITEQVGRVSAQFTEQVNRLSQPKGVAWPMVSVFLVFVLALCTWANSYFGQGISAAIRETEAVKERFQTVEIRVDKVDALATGNQLEHARAEAAAAVEAKYLARDLERMRALIDKGHAVGNPP